MKCSLEDEIQKTVRPIYDEWGDMKKSIKERWNELLIKIKRLPIEYDRDYDPDEDFDTRVKLPEWQTERLRKRKKGIDWRN